jgi:hypothetical protein
VADILSTAGDGLAGENALAAFNRGVLGRSLLFFLRCAFGRLLSPALDSDWGFRIARFRAHDFTS